MPRWSPLDALEDLGPRLSVVRPIEIGQVVLLAISLIGAMVLTALPDVGAPDWLIAVVGTLIARESVGLTAGRVKGGALSKHGPVLALLAALQLSACEWDKARHCDNLAKALRIMDQAVEAHRAQCLALDGDAKRACDHALTADIAARDATRRTYEIECTEEPIAP